MTDVAAAAGARDIYVWCKDFLPPLATLVASCAAIFLTWRFSGIQTRIDERQADIAHDRLRFDLLEKRHEIYREAQDLIREIVTERKQVEISTEDMNNAIIRLRVLDEARFFFPTDMCDIFAEIGKDIQIVVDGTRAHQRLHENEDTQRRAIADRINQAENRLRNRLQNMPEDFSAEMSFPQLIRRDPGSL